ncbi:MAG: hypothetical protein JWQ39_3028 [Glaciihabitans sp.]|jgi:uncharacterized protein (DUF1778 family)|nr:hypothetical protein [Glaciihabitans sp.]
MDQQAQFPISFRLSADERALVAQAARFKEQSVSSFIRATVVGTAAATVASNRDRIARQIDEQIKQLERQREEVIAGDSPLPTSPGFDSHDIELEHMRLIASVTLGESVHTQRGSEPVPLDRRDFRLTDSHVIDAILGRERGPEDQAPILRLELISDGGIRADITGLRQVDPAVRVVVAIGHLRIILDPQESIGALVGEARDADGIDLASVKIEVTVRG